MNIENAKKISLVELMGLWSYKPVKTNGVYVLYHAPYRVDKHASFKVDCLKNEWYDFSTGKGGYIIDLCKLVFNTYSVSEVLTRLDRMNLVIDCQTVSNPKPITPVEHTPYSIKDLRHPALFSYLRSRGIDIGIGEAYCKEIWYHLDKKPYFGIAFQNALGTMRYATLISKVACGARTFPLYPQNRLVCSPPAAYLRVLWTFLPTRL